MITRYDNPASRGQSNRPHYPVWPVLLLVLLVIPPLGADQLEEGLAAYRDEQWTKAQLLWQPMAKKGDVKAQFYLGTLFSEGNVSADFADQALYWVSRSAENGFAPAQFNLGNWYMKGRFVEPDMEAAVRWWRLAAEQNFIGAQFNLGNYYRRIGNLDAARRWMKRAAEAGLARAEETLTEIDEQLARTAPYMDDSASNHFTHESRSRRDAVSRGFRRQKKLR